MISKHAKKKSRDCVEDFSQCLDLCPEAQLIAGHTYNSLMVLMSVKIYLSSQAGFRGVSKCFGIFSFHFEQLFSQMSYSCVRQWILRLGYGLLHQAVERHPDWIYILDHSIQLGAHRCLLILGVRQASLSNQGYELSHAQMRVLDIHISSSYSGVEVYKRLIHASNRTGLPMQVISDQGSDIRSGINLFLADHPELIPSFDLTHKLGWFLKKHLQDEPRWLALQKDLRSVSHRTKQSSLSFLRPQTLSQKSRWLNIDKIMLWLKQIFSYQQRGDFSLIATGFKIENAAQVVEQLNLTDKRIQKRRAKKLQSIVAQSIDLPDQLPEDIRPLAEMVQWVDQGKQQFEDKFEPLLKYKAFAKELEELYQLLSQVKTWIKKEGLSLNTLQQIESLYDDISNQWSRKLLRDLINFLVQEHAKAPLGAKPLLLCSDVIESIFGKFKAKAKQSVGGIYATVLVIPLFCGKLSHGKIKEILEAVKLEEINKWIEDMRGCSNLTKRRRAFRFT